MLQIKPSSPSRKQNSINKLVVQLRQHPDKLWPTWMCTWPQEEQLWFSFSVVHLIRIRKQIPQKSNANCLDMVTPVHFKNKQNVVNTSACSHVSRVPFSKPVALVGEQEISIYNDHSDKIPAMVSEKQREFLWPLYISVAVDQPGWCQPSILLLDFLCLPTLSQFVFVSQVSFVRLSSCCQLNQPSPTPNQTAHLNQP